MEYTTKDVRRLLRMVRTRLQSGKIGPKHFDMDNVLYENDCGTVGCIGGWCLALSGNRNGNLTSELVHRKDSGRDNPLETLFFQYGMRRKTPAQAAKAITNYLDGERDPWRGLR